MVLAARQMKTAISNSGRMFPLGQILEKLPDKNFLFSNLQGLLGDLNDSHYVSGNCNVNE